MPDIQAFREWVCLLYQQGEQLHEQVHDQETVALAKQACRLAWQRLGEEHLGTALSLEKIGYLHQSIGDLAEAQLFHEQAVAIRRKVLGEDHLETADSLANLGFLHQALDEFAEARPCYEQALTIYRKVLGEEHSRTADGLNDLGLLLQDMGDLAAAQHCYEQALTIYRIKLGQERFAAPIFDTVGFSLQVRGSLVGARPYHEEALSIRRKVFGEKDPRTATSLSVLGKLLQDFGDYAWARLNYEQALAIRSQVLGDEHLDTLDSLHYLGTLLLEVGDIEGARLLLEKALAMYRRRMGDSHPFTKTARVPLTVVWAASGRTREAFNLMVESKKIDDGMIRQVFSRSSDRQRLTYLDKVRTNLDVFLSLVSQHLQNSPEAVRRGLELVLHRKAIAADASAVQHEVVLKGRYPHLGEMFQRLVQLGRQIAQKTLDGLDPKPGWREWSEHKDELDSHYLQLKVWNAEKERLEQDLASQIPEMDLKRRLRAVNSRAVVLALREGTALVEFVRFDVFDFHAVPTRGERRWKPARYMAFVLPAGEPDNVQMIDLGEAEPIDQMIADFRASITSDPEEGQRAMTPVDDSWSLPANDGTPAIPIRPIAGTELHQTVFDPLAKALGGRTRLLLAPDGDLTRLPFEVLPAGTDGSRLIDTYQISYLPSGRNMLRFGAVSSGQPASALVAADPDFDLGRNATKDQDCGPSSGRQSRDLDRGQACQRLPGTRAEGTEIARLLGVQPWLEREVLEAPLKAARSPVILHLATHGFFLKDQPHDPNRDFRDLTLIGSIDRLAGVRLENPLLRSGLLLAGFNTWRTGGTPPPEAEDGMLTAEDVTGFDLLDTELVVLSACGTGLGAVHVGEGVFGLRRTFAQAGAKTLVMSLWKVPDQQTRELMVDFYQRLLKGEPRAEALRQAQLAMKRRYPHPFYWGAFICQGNPGPLQQLSK
jgi:CHAT domain-containing protein/tetratricopeptide (TPR) repeat protein